MRTVSLCLGGIKLSANPAAMSAMLLVRDLLRLITFAKSNHLLGNLSGHGVHPTPPPPTNCITLTSVMSIPVRGRGPGFSFLYERRLIRTRIKAAQFSENAPALLTTNWSVCSSLLNFR